jgi:hypothetical protein
MTERKPHKWAEAIKAWADGKPIQFRVIGGTYWGDVKEAYPSFSNEKLEWRVKPEYVVIERCVQIPPEQGTIHFAYDKAPNIRFTFKTGKLIKAEVIE